MISVVSGEALKEKDVPISHIYASPSFRCVETATSLLQGKILSYLVVYFNTHKCELQEFT